VENPAGLLQASRLSITITFIFDSIKMAAADESKLKNLRKAHASDGLVVGLRDVAGVVSRLDIDVFMDRHPESFNLFLLALDKLKQDTTKMGYFQIAGM